MQRIQLVALCGSLIFMGIVAYSVWKAKLKEAYALLWLLMGVLFVGVSVWTSCLRSLSELIGIQYPPATLFLLLLMFIVLILFQYSLVLSRRSDDVRRLAQELSLLEERLRRLEGSGESTPKPE